MDDYVEAIGTAWSSDDEALVDSLVRPDTRRRQGTTIAISVYGRRLVDYLASRSAARSVGGVIR